MILLEVYNRAVDELLLDRFDSMRQEDKTEKLDYTVADFDGATYHVSNENGDRKKILVSIALNYFKELQEHGADQVLRREYGDLLAATPEPGFNVSICIDMDKLPTNYAQTARNAALLKRNCFAAVFEKFFEFQAAANTVAGSKRAIIHYRTDETMYVQALADRVTVIFSTMFKDPDDMIIGKLFLQEFTEVRRRFDRAPQVLYSQRVPPSELQGTDAVVNDNVAYITFVLFPRHLTPGPRCEATIDLIHTLRNYIHYHIKCSKAYIQMRMRAKTADFLKVLNRARPDSLGVPVVNVAPTGEMSASGPTAKSSVQASNSFRAMRMG